MGAQILKKTNHYVEGKEVEVEKWERGIILHKNEDLQPWQLCELIQLLNINFKSESSAKLFNNWI